MERRIEITALSGPEAETRWDCGPEAVTLGRARGNTIQLRDEAVSKHHALIEWTDDVPMLRDLDSRNGTFIDGVHVTTPFALVPGALITLGSTILRIGPGVSADAPTGASLAETTVHPAPNRGAAALEVARVDGWWRGALDLLRAARAPEPGSDPGELLVHKILSAVDADWVALVAVGTPQRQVSILRTVCHDDNMAAAQLVSSTAVQRVLRSDRPLLCEDAQPDPAVFTDARPSRLPRAVDVPIGARRSVLCVPYRAASDRIVAVIHAVREAGRPRFDAFDLQAAAFLIELYTAATPHSWPLAPDAPPHEVLDAGEVLVYRSRRMQSVVSIIRRAAATDATILLQGESGTGKEVLARLVHRWSRRAAKSMVRVNCASIEDTLAESELFGHERGAFTGALQQHRGRFEQADGGTLLLDEIGDLSPRCQAKLLRALEEGTIERLGGERAIAVDVRVIAATNQDLRQATAEGKFRLDLLHRIAVLPILVPALRDRREDIPLLVEHFAGLSARRYLQGRVTVEPEALALLQAADWPGNVRQLRNVIEQAMIQRGGSPLDRATVAAALEFHAGLPGAGEDLTGLALEDARREFERRHVLRVLNAHGWNRTQAARALGLARQNLVQKLKKLGIQTPGSGDAEEGPPTR